MSGPFELLFYQKADGTCQVRDYLRAQTKRVRGEAGWILERLETEGDRLERPATDFLEDGIYELRVIVDRQQHRILYFFDKRTIVATNAFLKKTQRVPRKVIDRAKRARKEWLGRKQREP